MNIKRSIAFLLSLLLVFNPPSLVFAQNRPVLGLPQPGTMVGLSSSYVPVIVKGLRVHPENPILFDFIVDTGDSGLGVNSTRLRLESEKLIKYFLASLTIPEDDLWVNLSPYEKDRIIPQQLGQTVMGRDMLAQDYILKQLTASLIYPEKGLGKEFWERVYQKAFKLYGTTQVPVNTFNKVWIVADKAKVYVHNNTAFIVGAHLKVMLEEDYLAMYRHKQAGTTKPTNSIGSQVVREVVLPELEKEVNGGKNFATLRQIFHSMILATWYRNNLKQALLNQVYAGKSKIAGLVINSRDVDLIYQQYLQAYKKGVFNYIKEDRDTAGLALPRKYFAGGLIGLNRAQVVNEADPDFAMAARKPLNLVSIQTKMVKLTYAVPSEEEYVDINRPILPQIMNIPPIMIAGRPFPDRQKIRRYAKEFVLELLLTNPIQEEGVRLQKAIIEFGSLGAVTQILSDYFIDYLIDWWQKRVKNLSLSNQEIISNALDKIHTSKSPIDKDNIDAILKNKIIAITGGGGTLAVAIENKYLDRKMSIISFLHGFRSTEEMQEISKGRRGKLYLMPGGDLKDIKEVLNLMEVARDLVRRRLAQEQKIRPEKVDERDVDYEVEQNTAVLHLGGLAVVSMNNPGEIFGNIFNTRNVLLAMDENAISTLVFTSSSTVYKIDNPYALSKYIEEKMISKFCQANYINFYIDRLANVAGSYRKGESIGGDHYPRLLPAIARAAKSKKEKEKEFTIFAGSKTEIGFIDFDDLADIMERTLAYGFLQNPSTILDIVPKQAHTLKTIVRRAKKLAKSKGQTFRVISTPGGRAEDSQPELHSPLFTDIKLGKRPQSTLNQILEKVWEAPVPKTPEKKEMDLVSEGYYMTQVREVVMDKNMFLDTGDILECLLGLLAFSANALAHTKENEFQSIQKEFFEFFQKKIKSYNPDEEQHFLGRFVKDDGQELGRLLVRYRTQIYKTGIWKKKLLYREHLKYIINIFRLWPSLRPKPGSDRAMLLRNKAPGGIDLNTENLQMETAPGSEKMDMGIDPAMIEAFKKGDFTGIVPVVLGIRPLPQENLQNILNAI